MSNWFKGFFVVVVFALGLGVGFEFGYKKGLSDYEGIVHKVFNEMTDDITVKGYMPW